MCCLYLTFSTCPGPCLPPTFCPRQVSAPEALRFQAGWLPCNCGFPRGQEFVYYSEFSVSVEQHSFQLSPLQPTLEGCVIPGEPTSFGLPGQIGPRKLLLLTWRAQAPCPFFPEVCSDRLFPVRNVFLLRLSEICCCRASCHSLASLSTSLGASCLTSAAFTSGSLKFWLTKLTPTNPLGFENIYF